MSNFDRAFDDLMVNEGGYSNNQNDPGGETMWGVTKNTAKSYGYCGPMESMPKSVAKSIYSTMYWEKWMENIDYRMAFSIFDTVVNSGKDRAFRILQKTLGVEVDGDVGNKTLTAIGRVGDIKSFIMAYNLERLLFLTTLPTWKSFSKGWTLRIINNTKVQA